MDFTESPTQANTYDIYTGVWTDWSRGSFLGLTLTLQRWDGNLLVAFLALFVSFAGTSFWRIACCVIHHCFSVNTAQDGVYHQRQAILRNSYNSLSGVAGLMQTLIAWRNHGKRTYSRLLPLLCFAICCVLAFGVAGTFSSRVSTSIGNEVLVRTNSKCGYINLYQDPVLTDVQNGFLPYMTQVGIGHANYAQQCYSNVTDLQQCNAFVKKRLPTTITRNASCPFPTEMCRTQDRNIIFDTGYLDSHKDLGINTPPEERVLFRRVSACAPLVTDGYRRSHNYSKSGPYVQYMYGQNLLTAGFRHPDFANLTDEEKRNLTFEYPNATLHGAHYDFDIAISDSFVINGTMTNDYSSFQPIPSLSLQEADLHLMFLAANSIRFSEPVDDPWYSAHWLVEDAASVERGVNVSGTMEIILQDEPLAPLACTVSEQYCNPNLPEGTRCPRMGGTYESERLARDLWSSERQRSVYKWIAYINTLISPTIDFVPKAQGSGSLTARYKAQGGVQGPLPDYQWQLETEYWHAASLVALQWWVVSIATGPSDDKILPWLVTLNGTDASALCENLKVFNSSYLNFSVVGLITILGVGGVLILLSNIIEPVVSLVQKRCKLDAYSRLEWATNETLQLQRLAHEELGMGTWRRCARSVPVTKGEEPLATLDLKDMKHPRLRGASYPREADSSASLVALAKDDEQRVEDKGAVEMTQEITMQPRIQNVEQADDLGIYHADWRAERSGSESTSSPVSLRTEDSPASTLYRHQDSTRTLVDTRSLEDRA